MSPVQLASRSLAAAFLVSLFVVTACSDDEPNNGVNDVRKACDIRVSWAGRKNTSCTDCLAAAPTVGCECPAFKDFAGLCQEQGTAVRTSPACTTEAKDCAAACNVDDCNCIEACYATGAECKQLAAARDGCVTDVCAKYCQ